VSHTNSPPAEERQEASRTLFKYGIAEPSKYGGMRSMGGLVVQPMPDVALPSLNEGLPLEYEGLYQGARRDVDVSDFVNQPEANGLCRVLDLSFSEELVGSSLVDLASLHDH
jgi:hypothetical protein